VSNGAITASVLINLEEKPPEDVVPLVIQKGNYPDSSSDEGEPEGGFIPSPYDPKLKAFGGKGPGQVDVYISEAPLGIVLQGYDGQGNKIPSAKKFVPFDE
jgi:hypothetical protein